MAPAAGVQLLFFVAAALVTAPTAAADWGQTRGGPGHTAVVGDDAGGSGGLRWAGDSIPEFSGARMGSGDGRFDDFDRVLDLAWSDGQVLAVAVRRYDGVAEAATVLAFDGEDGRLLWSRSLPGVPEQGPLVAEGSVRVRLGDRLLAFAQEDGTDRPGLDVTGATGHVSIAGTTVLYARSDGSLVAQALQGPVLWTRSWPEESVVALGAGPMVLPDGTILVTTDHEGSSPYGGRPDADFPSSWVRRIDATTGQDNGPRRQLHDHPLQSASYDVDRALIVTSATSVEILGAPGPTCSNPDCTASCGHGPDDATLVLNSYPFGPPAASGGHLVTWAHSSLLYGVDDITTHCEWISQTVHSSSGSGSRRAASGADPTLAPALGATAAYLPDGFDGLVAVETGGGTLWGLGRGLGLSSPPLVVDGTLYLFNGTGTLLAIDAGAGDPVPALPAYTLSRVCFCQLGLEPGPFAEHDLIVDVTNHGWADGVATVEVRIEGKAVATERLDVEALGVRDAIFDDLSVSPGDTKVEACLPDGRCWPATLDPSEPGYDGGGGGLGIPAPAAALTALLLAGLASTRRRR